MGVSERQAINYKSKAYLDNREIGVLDMVIEDFMGGWRELHLP